MSTRAAWSRQLRRLASANGWNVAHTRSGHFRLTHPASPVPVFTSSTPSDWRALRNLRAEMRRRGAAVVKVDQRQEQR